MENSKDQEIHLKEQIHQDPNFDQTLANARRFLELQQVSSQPTPPETTSSIRGRRMGRRGALRLIGGAFGVAALSRLPNFQSHVPTTLYSSARTPAKILPTDTPQLAEPPAKKSLPEQSPSPTPEKLSLANELLKPFIDEATRKRKERAKNDPEYLKRVDTELNGNPEIESDIKRLNILMFGYGEEHGETYDDMGGSISILSYDLKTGKIASLSLSRDIRTPELKGLVPPNKQEVIRHVYKVGGFDLMRKIAERATGLSADFQIVLKDTVIRDLLEKVVGSVDINVPKEHDTGSFRLGGIEHPGKYIPQGKQTMSAMEAMQLILAEDKKPVGKQDERSYRKNLLFKSIIQKVQDKAKNELPTMIPFSTQALMFLKGEMENRNIILDFDANLVTRGLQGLANVIQKSLFSRSSLDTALPHSDDQQEIVIHDSYWGDGAVTRAHNIRNYIKERESIDNPLVVKDVTDGKLSDLDKVGWMLIPDGGNPYSSDLIKDYWGSIRRLIKQKLTVT